MMHVINEVIFMFSEQEVGEKVNVLVNFPLTQFVITCTTIKTFKKKTKNILTGLSDINQTTVSEIFL